MRITKYNTILNTDKHCELIKEKSVNYQYDGNFSNPQSIYNMLCDVFQHDKQTEEYLYLLCFNTKCRLLGVFEISHGIVNASLCNTREIFQKALLCNASNIVLAHNHPSGDTTPSKEDMQIYRRVKEAADIMGIGYIDNLIIGNSYYSFMENGI